MYIFDPTDFRVALVAGVLFALSAFLAKRLAKGSCLVFIVFLGFFFTQFFVSIVIVSGSGYWSTLVMVPDEITRSLNFALYSGICISTGYLISGLWKGASAQQEGTQIGLAARLQEFGLGPLDQRRSGSVWKAAVLIASLTAFFLLLEAVWVENDIATVFYSQLSRGFGQFEERTILDRFLGVLFSLNVLLGLFGSVLVGRAFAMARPGRVVVLLPVAMFLLLICAAPLMHSFSRVSGAAFILAGLTYGAYGRRGSITAILTVLLVSFGLYLSFIGLSHRGFSQQGVASFLNAAFVPDLRALEFFLTFQGGIWIVDPQINFLDALGPFSASVHYSGDYEGGPILGLVWLAGILQPLPSFLIPLDYRPGAGLSTALGTFGRTGITTPALAELHYLMGHWGAFPLFLYGVFLRQVDRLSRYQGRLPLVVMMLAIAGIAIGGHNGLRAFARPTILAILLMALSGRKYILGRYCLDLRLSRRN